MSATQGAWECKHGVDGRDWCEECHRPVSANAIEALRDTMLALRSAVKSGESYTPELDGMVRRTVADFAAVEALLEAVDDVIATTRITEDGTFVSEGAARNLIAARRRVETGQ